MFMKTSEVVVLAVALAAVVLRCFALFGVLGNDDREGPQNP